MINDNFFTRNDMVFKDQIVNSCLSEGILTF